MKPSYLIQLLYRDFNLVTSELVLPSYDQVFEQEMREYFPFNETIIHWLMDLYGSEKYACFTETNLSFYFEKEHPFLFIRDLAHINGWNMGHRGDERRNHITGLMFSEKPLYA